MHRTEWHWTRLRNAYKAGQKAFGTHKANPYVATDDPWVADLAAQWNQGFDDMESAYE